MPSDGFMYPTCMEANATEDQWKPVVEAVEDMDSGLARYGFGQARTT